VGGLREREGGDRVLAPIQQLQGKQAEERIMALEVRLKRVQDERETVPF